ncbi:hypothetical protein KR032_008636 [Drosophila birchii]|nr:hypothetical protein KR032_008636 [Drosophila birchii]
MVVRRSYTIRNSYPGPLRTYDGEERCEPRLIRLSDLKSDEIDFILSLCDDQEETELKCETDEGESCEETSTEICEENPKEINEVKQEPNEINEVKEEQSCSSEEDLKKFESQIFINMLPQQKKSITLESICSDDLPTTEQLIRMELRARTLYEVATCQDPCAPPWECLESTQKLRFHWQAYAGVKLQEAPFDNFRQSYLKNRPKNCPKMGVRQIKSQLERHWCNMDRSQRMPFIVQSLLYQVSMGAINPRDDCAVREFFRKVK